MKVSRAQFRKDMQKYLEIAEGGERIELTYHGRITHVVRRFPERSKRSDARVCQDK